jgi:alanyl-tRNA synthetase
VLLREQALAIPNIIRTASDLLPPDIEMVRIVDITGIDIRADGGTHVASTADPDRGRRVIPRASAPSGTAPRPVIL